MGDDIPRRLANPVPLAHAGFSGHARPRRVAGAIAHVAGARFAEAALGHGFMQGNSMDVRAASCGRSSIPMTSQPIPAARFLYLHGFGSGPQSAKGVATSAHFASRGVAVERLDLRLPSLEHLRVSAMLEAVKQRIGGERDRAVLFGSSLGGLVASRVAEADARVAALVLLAPAFGLVPRWRKRLGAEAWARWESEGWIEVRDYTTGRPARVDHEFVRDLERVDPSDGGFPDVRVPTLIVHGVKDDVVDIEGSRAFASGRRHVRLVEVEDGHELSASVPRILAEADAFLVPFLGDPAG
jgi:uncharacterized protein